MEHVNGRVPVIMQIGTADTRSSIMLAKHAEGLGVAAIGLLPLYYGRPAEDAVLDHFRRVSDAVPLPIFMYDNTGTTQFKNSPKFIERLLREVPAVSGCKMSSYDMQDRFAWLRQVPPDFVYLEGYTEFLSVVVPLGAKGCMSPRAVVAPEMLVDVWKSIEAGDWNVTIPKLNNLWDTLKGVDDIAGREANREILRMRGIPIERMPRSLPTKGASPEVVQRLAKFLAEKGVPIKEPVQVG
jgi:dihydrodipicolinate synthase/N-acetylneuraminate lyase